MAASSRRPQGSNLIYWEKQGANRMCALHCINSLLQGPVYTETDMCKIGYEFDRKERQLLAAEGSASSVSSSSATTAENCLLGEDGNVSVDGYFNVSVLVESLRRQRVQCLSTAKPELREVLFAPEKEEGFILHLSDHWLALRKVDDVWYNLDSLKACPSALSSGLLREFLATLSLQGYSCFVARSDCGQLPSAKPQQVLLHQHYLTKKDIDEMQRKANEQEAAEAKKAVESSTPHDEESRSFLALKPANKEPLREWPVDQGYRLDDRNGSNSGNSEETEDAQVVSAEDAELQEALRLSLETFKQEMRGPGEEPAASEMNLCLISVRLRNGKKVQRRFRRTSLLKEVFSWAEYEAVQQQVSAEAAAGVATGCALIQTIPKRKFWRVGDRICLSVAGDSQSMPVTSCDLEALGFQVQEQLMMAPL